MKMYEKLLSIDELRFHYFIGDRVRIINYGNLVGYNKNNGKPYNFYSEDELFYYVDTDTNLVGLVGTVIDSGLFYIDSVSSYGIELDYKPTGYEKTYWYVNEQLEFENEEDKLKRYEEYKKIFYRMNKRSKSLQL